MSGQEKAWEERGLKELTGQVRRKRAGERKRDIRKSREAQNQSRK